jgi:hypothetical protein
VEKNTILWRKDQLELMLILNKVVGDVVVISALPHRWKFLVVPRGWRVQLIALGCLYSSWPWCRHYLETMSTSYRHLLGHTCHALSRASRKILDLAYRIKQWSCYTTSSPPWRCCLDCSRSLKMEPRVHVGHFLEWTSTVWDRTCVDISLTMLSSGPILSHSIIIDSF